MCPVKALREGVRPAAHVYGRNPVPGDSPAGHIQSAVAVVGHAACSQILEMMACVKKEIPGCINGTIVGGNRRTRMAPGSCGLVRPEKDTAIQGLCMLDAGGGSRSDLGSKCLRTNNMNTYGAFGCTV